jgi:hypothetical protein
MPNALLDCIVKIAVDFGGKILALCEVLLLLLVFGADAFDDFFVFLWMPGLPALITLMPFLRRDHA